MVPGVLRRLLYSVLLAALAAVFAAMGTVLAIEAFEGGDSSLLYAVFAALTLGLAVVGVLGAVIAAAGANKGITG